MTLIVLTGLALIIYSRNERVNPSNANAGPTATSNWHEALGFDICGTIHPALAANTNLASAGIRTFGDGLINVDPGAVSTPANFEGKNATLATFMKNYAGIDISPTLLVLNGKGDKVWQSGDTCTKADGPATGKGQVEIKLWDSPSAKGRLVSADPAKLALRDGQMIMVAFVPKGTAIPVPKSKDALLTALGQKVSGTTTSLAVETTTTIKAASGATGASASAATGATGTSPTTSGPSTTSTSLSPTSTTAKK
jgi:hypothetical protein